MSKKTEHVDGKNGENKEGGGGRRRRERVVESVETRTGRGIFFGERENGAQWREKNSRKLGAERAF